MSDQSNHGAPFFAVENGSYGTYDPRMPHRKVRIKIEHRIEYPDPLRVAAGERVNVGHEDAEFPGWKWCKASDGREGWVPVELLSNKGAEATVLQNYSAHELAVQPGEEVIVEESRHEWLLVRNALGECGWIPAANTEPAALGDFPSLPLCPAAILIEAAGVRGEDNGMVTSHA